jgi:hypothetical protein
MALAPRVIEAAVSGLTGVDRDDILYTKIEN